MATADHDRIILVDAYAQIYRGFYAIRGLTNPAGVPTNALFAVARFLMWLDREIDHGFGAVVFDKGPPKKRLELLPEYKATRPPMPDDLRQQLDPIREWIVAAGWPLLEKDGFEADDLIAGLATANEGHEVYIVSHDKDLGQLVGNDVYQLIPGKKGKLDILGPAEVTEKFGVPPGAIRDYLALVGDSVDNIPGVPGVGPKTATALLQKFGSIDDIVAHLAAIPSASVRAKIEAAKGYLDRNRELVELDRVLPEDWHGVAGLRRRSPNWEKLLDIARRNNFKSLVTSLEKARHDARNPTLF